MGKVRSSYYAKAEAEGMTVRFNLSMDSTRLTEEDQKRVRRLTPMTRKIQGSLTPEKAAKILDIIFDLSEEDVQRYEGTASEKT